MQTFMQVRQAGRYIHKFSFGKVLITGQPGYCVIDGAFVCSSISYPFDVNFSLVSNSNFL